MVVKSFLTEEQRRQIVRDHAEFKRKQQANPAADDGASANGPLPRSDTNGFSSDEDVRGDPEPELPGQPSDDDDDSIDVGAGFQPFPTHAIPEPLRSYVTQAAAAIDCDETCIILPLLAAVSAAIGNTRIIRPKASWPEPPVLWTVFAVRSGATKSPAVTAGTTFAERKEDQAFQKYRQAMKHWELLKENEPEVAGKEPVQERRLVSDVTVEAVAELLQANPRGLLLAKDELAGWFQSFNQYRGGKGGDMSHWLSMHGAKRLQKDRKKGNHQPILVPRAFVAVTGSIQPRVLARLFTAESFETGLVARFLMAMPPKRKKQWTELVIHEDTEAAVAEVFRQLWLLQGKANEDDNCEPESLPLSPAGKEVFIQFYNAHAEEEYQQDDDLAAAWSKLEGYCVRLALIIHCARVAASDPTVEHPDQVDAESVRAAKTMVDWFDAETKRIYAVLATMPKEQAKTGNPERLRAAALEFISKKEDKRTTVRELQRSSRLFWPKGAAEETLDALVEEGVALKVALPKNPKYPGRKNGIIYRLITTS